MDNIGNRNKNIVAIVVELRDGTSIRLLSSRYPVFSNGTSGYLIHNTSGLLVDSLRNCHWTPATNPIHSLYTKYNQGKRT